MAGEMLSRYKWELFNTHTFGGYAPHPERAKKAVEHFMRRVHVDLYGERFDAAHNIPYVVTVERGRIGKRTHAHALVSGGDRVAEADWQKFSAWWQEACGYAWFQAPRSVEDVRGYVASYISKKDSDVDICSTWEDECQRESPAASYCDRTGWRSLVAARRRVAGLPELPAGQSGPLFETGIEIVQSSELLRSSNCASWRRAAFYATDHGVAPGSNGPERDAGASAPAVSTPAGACLFPELSASCSAPGMPAASKTVSCFSQRRARKAARAWFHTPRVTVPFSEHAGTCA